MSVAAESDLAPALVIADRDNDVYGRARARHGQRRVGTSFANAAMRVGKKAAGLPDGLMDLDEGEEVSPAEIAGIMSELGVATKPKAQAASRNARPQLAATAAVVPGGSAMGPASGPSTGFDLARNRLADYQRAAVQAKRAGDMGRATALLRRSKELKAACDAAARELLAAFPPPEVADLEAPAAAPTPTPAAPDSAPPRDERPAAGAPTPAHAPAPEVEAEADPHREADRALVRAMDSGDADAIEAAIEEHASAASEDVLGLVRRAGQRKRAAEAAAAEAAATQSTPSTETAAPPLPAPPPAPPPAPAEEEKGGAGQEAAAAAAAEEEEEEEEEEDHVLAAEAYAAQLTSYNVLEWELAKLQGDTLDEAAEERREGEWPPMHSAPALPIALGRPPVGRCVASAKVPPCAAPTASARLGRTAIHSNSTCIRMCTACSLHMHHMPTACAPQRSRRAR